jgi:hypothetical protein
MDGARVRGCAGKAGRREVELVALGEAGGEVGQEFGEDFSLASLGPKQVSEHGPGGLFDGKGGITHATSIDSAPCGE